ncbi:MAG: hypothetical protein NWE92_11010 [Candidatus Bathyarchaeota archaeon]|nr:hypothetical protein [Candidatus Bathyarchaeota archaeon]
MNSLTLKENGFKTFLSLKELTFSGLSSNKNSVLVLVDTTLTEKPTSDILYIGKTKKPAKRIFGGYIAGYGGKTTRKINSMLLDEGYLEKIAVGCMESDNPKVAQQQLLDDFKKEYGQYPAWNLNKKATPAPQPATKTPKTPKPARASKPTKAKPTS